MLPEAEIPVQEQLELTQSYQKKGLGGWLALPTLAIVWQPIGFVWRHYEAYREWRRLGAIGAVRYWVNYPVLAIDVVILICVALLGYLFFKKKRIAPPGFVIYSLLIFCLWNYTDAFLSELRAAVIPNLVHCLLFIPYMVFSRRVRNTFTAELGQTSWIDRLLGRFAPALESFYGFLRRRRWFVIPAAVLFVVINTVLYALVRAVFYLHDITQFRQLLS
jgi:hypothetical protein